MTRTTKAARQAAAEDQIREATRALAEAEATLWQEVIDRVTSDTVRLGVATAARASGLAPRTIDSRLTAAGFTGHTEPAPGTETVASGRMEAVVQIGIWRDTAATLRRRHRHATVAGVLCTGLSVVRAAAVAGVTRQTVAAWRDEAADRLMSDPEVVL